MCDRVSVTTVQPEQASAHKAQAFARGHVRQILDAKYSTDANSKNSLPEKLYVR